jgi:hypothetical protein
MKGKIAYLIRIPDYDQDDEVIPGSGTWVLQEEKPSRYMAVEVKKIVYFEVE